MATYLVTGGTGFLGRHVLPRILDRDASAEIHVLVRPASAARLQTLVDAMPGGDRVHSLIGDLTEPGLGITTAPAADHVLHLGAIYDLTVGDEQAATNVEGTRSVIALARQLDATLHHVSSIAVAGDYAGRFTERDLDLGQGFPTAYHRTKFEAEKLVREAEGLRWRIYRPSMVVGSSVTGEMDKIDGLYFLFPAIAALAKLPESLPVAVPRIGSVNLVPVDYVAAAIVELMAAPQRDGHTFHLVNPRPQPVREIYGALAKAAGAPHPAASLPGGLVRPFLTPAANSVLDTGRKLALRGLKIPPVLAENSSMPAVFASDDTQDALRGTGIQVPDFASYTDKLWTYWTEHLDPDRARRPHPDGPLMHRHVVITGASSGIGRSAAIATAGEGARVILLARRAEELQAVVAEIREEGGEAFGYPCDITDDAAVKRTVETILAEHDHIDMLVNNAGRSIRRGLYRSTDRLHDFERTMAVNYFGAVRLVLAFLPQMRERRFGHIVNVSSAGVQFASPRFSAYIASKAALDGFTDVAAAETLSDGITFTTIHMPLVKTPMIQPTSHYNDSPSMSPERAAAMVVRALIERPKRIDVPVGTLGEFGQLFTPATKDRLMHQVYRRFPDSQAAKGEATPTPPRFEEHADEPAGMHHDDKPSVLGRAARQIGRLVPGAHW
ncbi:short chain dehydrogenase [Rhodococcus sp. WMMA185]|uniref:SDR family oxidoreductase n=1 Tax=Rhodococcus sp. WMMA185 TaxID=679318 RepID=UPI000878861D|nr:SDR family oxidoreductase [Rhodococcus sp. WMMA185]AOW92135.1 short chain dehydrogenase [Rhodococcus sp. WMMA185]